MGGGECNREVDEHRISWSLHRPMERFATKAFVTVLARVRVRVRVRLTVRVRVRVSNMCATRPLYDARRLNSRVAR